MEEFRLKDVPNDLFNKKTISSVDVHNLIKRISSSRGCDTSIARRVVRLWIDAFGVSEEKDKCFDEELDDDIYYSFIDRLELTTRDIQ